MVINCPHHGEGRLTLVFIFPHVDHHCRIVSYGGGYIRNAKASIVGIMPPAEEKKMTMIALVRVPVRTFPGRADLRQL